jgi:hypothetical protein
MGLEAGRHRKPSQPVEEPAQKTWPGVPTVMYTGPIL